MAKRVMCAVAVATGMLAANAQAAVRYDFTAYNSFDLGTIGTISGSFSYIAPDFITTPRTVVPVEELTACSITATNSSSIACAEQVFSRSNQDVVEFSLDNGSGFGIDGTAFYYFRSGAFAAVGTYDTVAFGQEQAGQLVVTNLGGPAVPEPATWASMIIGFGVVGAGLRVRRRRVALRLAAA